jgi:hypothetical protein
MLLALLSHREVRNDHRDCLQVDKVPEAVRLVPLIEEGLEALDKIDSEMGLAFDDWDKKYYYNLFVCALLLVWLLSIPLSSISSLNIVSYQVGLG